MIDWLASIPVLLKILVFLGSTLSLLLLAYLFYRLVSFWISLNKLKLKDRFAIKNDVIKTTAQILGGAFFIAGLVFTYKNLVATQEKNITDLYTKAIEQLGKPQLEVRLGGIYALERIARDSEKDHWPIMEVLTAYVRENAPWPPETLEEARKKRSWAKPKTGEGLVIKTDPEIEATIQTATQAILLSFGLFTRTHKTGEELTEKGKAEKQEKISIEPDPDIQAILTIIGRRARTYKNGEKQGLDLTNTDLRGANLRGAHLEVADLSRAHLEGRDSRWLTWLELTC